MFNKDLDPEFPWSGNLPIAPYSPLSFTTKHYVYFLLSKECELLYIGVTSNVRQRLMNHYRNSKKNNLGFYFYELERFDDRKSAETFEAQLIIKHRPKLNEDYRFMGVAL
jgi:predicted GIY-YIG superfamily endonuclease